MRAVFLLGSGSIVIDEDGEKKSANKSHLVIIILVQ